MSGHALAEIAVAKRAAASAWAAENIGTTARPRPRRACDSVTRRSLSSTAYGVSCRARAERLALRRIERRFAPGPGFPGPTAWFPRSHPVPRTEMGFGVMSRSKRGTLAEAPAGSVRARDGSPRGRGRAPRRRDRRAGPAVRRRRPRRLRRQRRRPAAPRRRARRSGWRASRCAAARCSSARSLGAGFRGTLAFTLPEALWLAGHGCATSSSPTRRPTARALRALAARDARARGRVMVDDVAQLDLIDARPAPRRTRRCASASTSTPAGGRSAGGVRIGAKRSPLHTPAQARRAGARDRRRGRRCGSSG